MIKELVILNGNFGEVRFEVGHKTSRFSNSKTIKAIEATMEGNYIVEFEEGGSLYVKADNSIAVRD